MSKALDALRALDIWNPHNACTYAAKHGGAGVYLDRRSQITGRAFQSAAWQVVRPGYKTDPGGHWRDYGNKTFTIGTCHTDAEALALAKDWASTRYGVAEWVKIPGLPRALYPAQDAAIIKAALRKVTR